MRRSRFECPRDHFKILFSAEYFERIELQLSQGLRGDRLRHRVLQGKIVQLVPRRRYSGRLSPWTAFFVKNSGWRRMQIKESISHLKKDQ